LKKSVATTAENKPEKSSKAKTKKHTLFVEITPEKYFVMCDGKQVKNFKELADILRIVSDDVFFYHVNEQRNDFATWVKDVFNEQDLAKRMQNIHNRMEMGLELYKNMFEKLEKLNKKQP